MEILAVMATLSGAPQYTCEDIRRYVSMLGIEFVIRQAKARGASDEEIKQMRAKCRV